MTKFRVAVPIEREVLVYLVDVDTKEDAVALMKRARGTDSRIQYEQSMDGQVMWDEAEVLDEEEHYVTDDCGDADCPYCHPLFVAELGD